MDNFELAIPRTISEAMALLPADWDESGGRSSTILAGGQDLLTVLKEGLESPEMLVHLRGVKGLNEIDTSADGTLRMGAMTRISALAGFPLAQSSWAALAEAAESVGSPQIRNQGTVGGNLCQRPRCWYFRNSDAPCLKKGGYECFAVGGRNKYNAILGGGPSYIVHPSDLAPALVMMDATLVCQSPRGERRIRIADFYTLPEASDVTRETVLASDEIILRVEVPSLPEGMVTAYMKARERGSFDFALSAVALGLRVSDGVIRECRLVLGGVAPTPWRCAAAERLAIGRENNEATWAAVAEAALEGAEPLSENGYKLPLTKGLIEKAMRRLAGEVR